MMERRVLVVGARDGSLGQEIEFSIMKNFPAWLVETAGLDDGDAYTLDALNVYQAKKVFQEYEPTDVICTVGINKPMQDSNAKVGWMQEHFEINCIAPMLLLQEFLPWGRGFGSHFVAISSNSAQIARRNSMAYCASKAALSMALRVAAREEAMGRARATVYGYELGLLVGTPMTKETEKRFGPSATRIPGNPKGLSTDVLADQIIGQLAVGGAALNGTLLRLDGGEQ